MTDLIVCGRHGETPAAFVCSHMHEAWKAGRAPHMVCQAPITEDPWPDAWCEACEVEFQARYDELTDGFTGSGGLVVVCTGCYEAMRAAADEAGTLRVV